MSFAVLQHYHTEGPGTLGDYLKKIGAEINIFQLFAGMPVPEFGSFDALISMGGPMNVYEEDKYPFLREETLLIQKCLSERVPVLGICLGAQMLAKAAAAEVVKAPCSEIGWHKIELLQTGKSDPLFKGWSDEIEVFQYHGDMFKIPDGGACLASSRDCPHQAFRVGASYGLQFHVEVDEAMIRSWFEGEPHGELYASEYAFKKTALDTNAQMLYNNFVELISVK